VEIDTWSALRANEFCPDNKVSGTFVNIPDSAAVAWLNTPAGASVAARLGLTTATIDTVPSSVCDINTEIPIARIVSPAEGQVVSGVMQITGSASASTFTFQLSCAGQQSEFIHHCLRANHFRRLLARRPMGYARGGNGSYVCGSPYSQHRWLFVPDGGRDGE
jgi:hypothetical protein